MNPDLLLPLGALAVALALGAIMGVVPTRRLITIREAKHELKQGSASRLREMGGWVFAAMWLLVLWFVGSVVGDWIRLGDLDAALTRSELRLRIVADILLALASD